MNDHSYEQHAKMLALRNAVAFIVQTLPEEQKETVLNALKILAEVKLVDDNDTLSTSNITAKTVDKMNKAYKGVLDEIINLSTPDLEPGSTRLLQ